MTVEELVDILKQWDGMQVVMRYGDGNIYISGASITEVYSEYGEVILEGHD
jgi:hypothetical protein